MALENLNQFTGSENYHRHGMNRKFIYTDGVQYVAEEGGAYWLLDEVALANMFDAKLKEEGFQTWILQKGQDGNSAILSADNGNGNALFAKSIPFTDFPLNEIKFYVVDAPDFGEGAIMMMLPSEY